MIPFRVTTTHDPDVYCWVLAVDASRDAFLVARDIGGPLEWVVRQDCLFYGAVPPGVPTPVFLADEQQGAPQGGLYLPQNGNFQGF